MELEKLKLHFAYVVGILVAAMIIISTGLWTDKDNFTEYMTNAATAISIVLGLVAIFYSFISNSSLSQSLGNISKVSDEVLQTKSQIEKFLDHANDLERLGAENSRSLMEISTSVENHVTSLKAVLGGVEDKTKLLHETVDKKFCQLETRLTDFAEANSDTTTKVKGVTESKEYLYARAQLVSSFMGKSSIIGRSIMYGCVLANKSNKPFFLEKFASLMDFDESYAHGFMVAFIATTFMEKEDVAGEKRAYVIIRIEEAIKEQIKTSLIELINKKYNEKSQNKEYAELTLAKIESLEKSFQE